MTNSSVGDGRNKRDGFFDSLTDIAFIDDSSDDDENNSGQDNLADAAALTNGCDIIRTQSNGAVAMDIDPNDADLPPCRAYTLLSAQYVKELPPLFRVPSCFCTPLSIGSGGGKKTCRNVLAEEEIARCIASLQGSICSDVCRNEFFAAIASGKDIQKDVATRPENDRRNRYRNVLPYDRNRVRLKEPTAVLREPAVNAAPASPLTSDYINASFLRLDNNNVDDDNNRQNRNRPNNSTMTTITTTTESLQAPHRHSRTVSSTAAPVSRVSVAGAAVSRVTAPLRDMIAGGGGGSGSGRQRRVSGGGGDVSKLTTKPAGATSTHGAAVKGVPVATKVANSSISGAGCPPSPTPSGTGLRFGCPLRFVTCQAPLPATVAHFWQMVWEQTVRLVLTCTNEVERGHVKGHRYWPARPGDVLTAGSRFVVRFFSEKVCGEFTVRHFGLYRSSVTADSTGVSPPEVKRSRPATAASRSVYQLHYTEWPDQRAPQTTSCVHSYLALARRLHDDVSTSPTDPLVVHCSAGIGRTGTLVIILTLMYTLEALEAPSQLRHMTSLLDVLKTLRVQRYGMVQTPEQYVFCYKSLIDLLTYILERKGD